MRPHLLLLALLPSTLLASCAYTVTTPRAQCVELLPKKWAEGVAGHPLPDFATVDQVKDPTLRTELEKREWQKAFVGQSVQLEISNGRYVDAVHIIGACERLANEARDRAGKRWWQFWR